MFSYPTNTDIPKHNIHLFPFISLQRDDHSCWNFSVDLLSIILVGAFQIASAFLVICCSDFEIMDHDSDLLDADLVSWWIFSNNRRRLFRSRPMNHFKLFKVFWLIRQILFTSVPLYYFDLKSDWLPFETVAFGSPPEDLLFLYLLFVPIR